MSAAREKFKSTGKNCNVIRPFLVYNGKINSRTLFYFPGRAMKILLVANYVPDCQQSMQRYADLLEKGLTEAGQEVRIIRPLVKAGKFALSESGVKWLGYIDKLVLFPKALKEAVEWADVVHICDHSNAVYVKHVQAKPHIVTCHDLLAVRSALGEIPRQETRWSGRKLQRMILDGMAAARNIVCVSRATRSDVARLVPNSGAQVSHIYNGLNYPYEPMDSGEAALRLQKLGIAPDQAFIFHVGGNQWYKNRLAVLKIFVQLRKRKEYRNLVLIMAGKPWTEEMRQFVRVNELEWCVVELIDAAEEDLRALYSRAEVFVFPSLEEGFGWPIAEAQACGCPVVTSNRAPMTEVGGEAATYIDPLDYESAAAAIAAAMGSRAVAGEASRRNAARFNTNTMINAYLAIYQSLNGNAVDGTAVESAASRIAC
jgi:glycosyltransferase involved in cell wall biosynthesis